MLEGTDLSSAYGSPLMSRGGSMFEEEDAMPTQIPIPPKKQQEVMPKPLQQVQAQQQNPIMQQLATMQETQQKHMEKPKQPAISQQQFDAAMFNRQFDQYHQPQYLLPQAKPQMQQQPQFIITEPSYWDRLSSKKKETTKFIQSALIILFAISLHFVIDFVLKHYLEMYDISWNRELLIRILYPLGILFIAWNIIAFIR